VVADFAIVGTLAAVDILLRQDVENATAGTFILLAGLAGGGGAGWLLTEKFDIDAGSAHATTIGMLAGAANGALLIEPTESYDAEDVIGLLFLGSAIGATGGFAYGRAADLTSGQATFLGNAVLLGSATAALGAIAGSRDGEFGNWENGTLALGLDVGILGGALIAPALDWSPGRAKTVFAATTVGALLGGALPGLITKREEGEDYNGDLIAGCMTGGLWVGFVGGIVLTTGSEPDTSLKKTSQPAGTALSVAPWVGKPGQLGLMTGGTW